ncbi:hypothetical protein HRW23_31210 [Streptomyces lunaelactis]|uniref:hypothetical protein n=1 Tax=Streptomyces lunaelactis TaxID=1535768 RepID=UPI0015847C42|nr:hypothetical protein [Streptomyces lunaelactis]NUK70503.1 hypothetical protein [Streptomyces lunaelactis]NUK81766.1 hypothetical protein [Streptomyces lunaelactis]
MTTPEIRAALPQPAASVRGPVLRKLRGIAFPAQLVLAVCLISGVPIPGTVLLGGKLLLLVLLGTEAHVWLRLRRHGLSRRETLAQFVPEPVLRFVTHELRIMASLVRWAARRRHGVNGADAVFSHGRDQASTMYGFAFACVVETVALSYLLADWPVVHAVFLVVDVYTVLFVLGVHAASVTRPHALADGALRVRQAAHVDVHVPLDQIASIRRETLFTHEKKDDELNLPIGSQTSITLALTEPVNAPKFLGAPRLVKVIRLHADDPKALHDAVTRARTAPTPVPGTPASA